MTEEFCYLGNGVAFAVLVQRGRPAGSDGFVEARIALTLTSADRLVGRTVFYCAIDEGRTDAERLAEERG